jgi:hypothetical protein
VEVRFYEGLASLPPFDPGLDLDATAYRAPVPVMELRRALLEADGFLICIPEYAFGMPGVLKNMLDGTFSMNAVDRKPTAVLAASPMPGGGTKAHQSLLWVLGALHVEVVEGASFCVDKIRTRLDAAGKVIDPGTLEALRSAMGAVVANSCMTVPRHPLIELKVVSGRFDAADDWIVEETTPKDAVITSDIPLAARVLAKGARALDPKGRIFSPDSIGDALAAREFSVFLRDMGEMSGGPAPFSAKDRSRFLQSLDTVIQSLLKAQRAQELP